MTPGETILGLDLGNHLWVVLSNPMDGTVAVANLTTHGKSICNSSCVVIAPGEHSYPNHESCMYYRQAYLNPVKPLDDDQQRGTLNQYEPFSAQLLDRVQRGALVSPMTSPLVKEAIRKTLGL